MGEDVTGSTSTTSPASVSGTDNASEVTFEDDGERSTLLAGNVNTVDETTSLEAKAFTWEGATTGEFDCTLEGDGEMEEGEGSMWRGESPVIREVVAAPDTAERVRP